MITTSNTAIRSSTKPTIPRNNSGNRSIGDMMYMMRIVSQITKKRFLMNFKKS